MGFADMTISEHESGTHDFTSEVGDTWRTLNTTTPNTTDACVQAVIETNGFVAGKDLEARIIEKVVSGGTQRTLWQKTVDISVPALVSPPLLLLHGWDVQIRQRLGAAVTSVPWSIRKATTCSEQDSGTKDFTGLTGDTWRTLNASTPNTTDGAFQFFIDTNSVIAGNEFEFRVIEKPISGGTQRLVWEGALNQPRETVVSPAITLLHGWDFQARQRIGTALTAVPWSIRIAT